MTKKQYIAVLIAALALITAHAALAGPGKVKINIAWEYKDFPAAIELYELKGKAKLWDTKSVKNESAPLGAHIEGSSFTLKPGETKRFVLATKNTTPNDIYFFSGPHTVNPVEHSLGFKFKCLCVNNSFLAKSGETWYRVVEFKLSKDFVGEEIAITHTIIAIDKERAKAFGASHGGGEHEGHD
ncbi:MAG: hypothetical protein OEV59_08890 [Deltaproteobacteria bacterium]|nr:hypothetical protein [Deltaproteobacteria bacterium]